ncbi:class I SAM-dependent methyltransferase [Gymnodinialimonas sp. 2305UL16-5]|uniref:class I SAM-dependent methyltransferase n=1 Tax=Gymnodinialimonas mytili TaxID=3126503 RepID=UPI0030ACAAD8
MQNWDEMAAPWLRAEARMEAAHAPVLEALLAASDLRIGHRVLDIGIGSGLSTLRAAQIVGRNGHVTGADVAPPFVRRAAERVPDEVTLVIADAEVHGFQPRAFDRVISLFGTMFFSDTIAAFANIRRATALDGEMTLAAWAPPSDNPWLSVAGRVATEILGPPPVPTDPAAPGPFRFADPEIALQALAAAGWKAQVETRDLPLTPTGTPNDIAETQMDLGVAARRIADETPDAATIQAIRDEITARFATMQSAGGAVHVPARIHLFHAQNAP